jgi:hypothetical protein
MAREGKMRCAGHDLDVHINLPALLSLSEVSLRTFIT